MERTKVRGCSQGFCPSEFTRNPRALRDASPSFVPREPTKRESQDDQGTGVGVIFQMSATHWPLPCGVSANAFPVPQ